MFGNWTGMLTELYLTTAVDFMSVMVPTLTIGATWPIVCEEWKLHAKLRGKNIVMYIRKQPLDSVHSYKFLLNKCYHHRKKIVTCASCKFTFMFKNLFSLQIIHTSSIRQWNKIPEVFQLEGKEAQTPFFSKHGMRWNPLKGTFLWPIRRILHKYPISSKWSCRGFPHLVTACFLENFPAFVTVLFCVLYFLLLLSNSPAKL